MHVLYLLLQALHLDPMDVAADNGGVAKAAGPLRCYCQGLCPSPDVANGTCVAKDGAKCFAAVEEVWDEATGRLVPERTYGCLPPDETGLLQVSK